MKLQLLAGAIIASSISLLTFAQVSHPAVHDGSNGSRAPLPTNRPFEYNFVAMDGAVPADAIIVANHIGEPTPNQFVASVAPTVPATPVYTTTTTIAEPVLISTVPATSAQSAVAISHPPVRDGSIASRAPLPENRPFEYDRVAVDGQAPADSMIVAAHIGESTSVQSVAAIVPATQVYATTTTITEPVLMPIAPTARYSDLGQTIRINKNIRAAKINDQNVVVGTIDGRVTLRGWVNTDEDKRRIGEIAIAASSFELVDNQIEVGNPVTGS